MEHLNGLHHRIQFTIEKEDNQKLPFLDVLVERNKDGLTTDIYQKPTHTKQYLHYRSNHHPRVKNRIVHCSKTRAERICDGEKFKIEARNLKDVIQSIEYPSYKIQSLLKIRNNIQRRQPDEEEKKKTLMLSYIPEVSENIATSCKKLPVKVAFMSKRTLKTSLSKLKLPTPPMEKTGVVYAIHCECGGTYIGETGRTLKVRMTEHKRAIKIGDPHNAISVHVNNTGHNIKWDESEILVIEENLQRRKPRESILIRNTPNNINTDPGVYLNPTWTSILQGNAFIT